MSDLEKAESFVEMDSSEQGGRELQDQEPDQDADLGLQLTVSFRSGVSRADIEAEKPPDRGWRAWSQALAMHLVVASTWGFINAFGVYQSYYADTLTVSASAISWIGSLQIFLLFSLGTFTGRALDAGYFNLVFRTGCLFIIAGIFLTSIGTQYFHFLLTQGLLIGIGSGMVFCPAVALTTTYFSAHRSLAVGIGASGSATGGILIPLFFQRLAEPLGFAWAVRCTGFLILTFLSTSALLFRPRVKPRKVGGIVDWSAFHELPYVLFALGMFLVMLGLYFAFFYVSAFAKQRLGLNQKDAFNTLIIMNAVGMPGRIIPNYIADRTGPLNILTPSAALAGISFFAWMAVGSYGSLLGWACCYGIVAAAVQSLFPACLSSLTRDLSKAGGRMGAIFTIVSFASLTGNPIGGAIIGRAGGDYKPAMAFAGSVVVVGSVILVAARVCKTGRRWRKRA